VKCRVCIIAVKERAGVHRYGQEAEVEVVAEFT
jgi:hypothetical protein